MTRNEWYNLIVLSKSDFRLAGTILEGSVDEFLNNSNLSEVPKFTLIEPTVFNIEISVRPYYYLISTIKPPVRKLKRGSKIKSKNYKVTKYFPNRPWVTKEYDRVDRWEVVNILKEKNGRLLKKTPVDGLWELKIPNFRLRFSKHNNLYYCRVQIKYKLSNTKNELFNLAFNNANRYPKKGKYVNFIDFIVDEKPEEILWYLTKILKK